MTVIIIKSTFISSHMSVCLLHIPPGRWRLPFSPSAFFTSAQGWLASKLRSTQGDMLKGNILPPQNPKGTCFHCPEFGVLTWLQEKMLFLKKSDLNHSEICEPTPVFPAPLRKQHTANATSRIPVHPVLQYLVLANSSLHVPRHLFQADWRWHPICMYFTVMTVYSDQILEKSSSLRGWSSTATSSLGKWSWFQAWCCSRSIWAALLWIWFNF